MYSVTNCKWIMMFSLVCACISTPIEHQQMRILEDSRRSRLICETPLNIDYISYPTSCRGSNSGPEYNHGEHKHLVVLVLSHVDNVDKRNDIRSTWANRDILMQTNIKLIFVVGVNSKRNHEQENIDNDILKVNIEENYENVKNKVILAMKWIVINCKHGHLLKTDDDMFIDLLTLADILGRRDGIFLMGSILVKSKPSRFPQDKFYVSNDIWKAEYYPDYVSGSAYIISNELLSSMCRIPCSRLKPYWSGIPWEDVYLTGLIAGVALRSRLTHASRFSSSRQHYLQPDEVVATLSPLVPSSPLFNSDPDNEITIDTLGVASDDYHGDTGTDNGVNSAERLRHSIWNCVDLLTFRGGSLTSVLWNRTYTC